MKEIEFTSLPQQAQDYIRDLVKIHVKHGIDLGRCKCCSSPWAGTLNRHDLYLAHIRINVTERKIVEFEYQGKYVKVSIESLLE